MTVVPVPLVSHIVLDEEGVARIAGTRMKVIHLVMDKMANNSTPDEMLASYPHLTLAQIHAAMTYYYDHKADLDSRIQEDFRLAEEMRAAAIPVVTREELLKRHQQQGR